MRIESKSSALQACDTHYASEINDPGHADQRECARSKSATCKRLPYHGPRSYDIRSQNRFVLVWRSTCSESVAHISVLMQNVIVYRRRLSRNRMSRVWHGLLHRKSLITSRRSLLYASILYSRLPCFPPSQSLRAPYVTIISVAHRDF